MIEIIFLGTSCMQPTKERNHSGILIRFGPENILMDCGEGIQRQLKIAGIKPAKITKVLISHWHGDHVLGLPGLIQTMGANEYSKKLLIYGPENSKNYMQHMMKAFFSKGSIQFELKEINEGVFFENNTFKLTSMPLKHGIKTVGFSFIEKDRRRIKVSHIKKLGIPDGPLLGKLQRGQKIKWKGKEIKADDVTYVVKGKKIAYIADTLSCNNAVKLAENADLLISEASFITEHLEKAEGYKHLTAKDAALIANSAGAKKLILTHFSQRYKETKDIEEEAKDYFNDVTCAYDFMKIKV